MFKRKNSNHPPLQNFQAYTSIRESLEQQNATLMKERQNMQGAGISIVSRPIPSQCTIIEQSGLSDECSEEEISMRKPIPVKQVEDRISVIQKKIEQVIGLCYEGSKNCNNETLKLVTEAEKQILLFLSYFRKDSPLNEPISKIKQVRPQSSNIKVNKESNKHKISSKDDTIMSRGGLISMIDQIEIKALAEIENLRKTNISLMKKLNEEMAAHNQQKRRRVVFQSTAKSLVDSLKKYDSHKGDFPLVKITKNYEKQQKLSVNNHNHALISKSKSQQVLNHLNQQEVSNLLKKEKQTDSEDISTAQGQIYLNLQHIQNMDEGGQPGNSLPQISSTNLEIDVQNQINRLKLQNMHMRQNIANQKSAIVVPIKEQLKNQLRNLQQKAKYYQQFIAISKPVDNGKSAIVQNLLQEGANLASEGQKLMRVRSKPQFVTFNGSLDNTYKRSSNVNESSVIKQNWNQSGKDINFVNQFQPTQYELVMNQMKKAIHL